ncbi:dTDP-4-dehydrorhamnose reductase [Bradyrhizobium sp. STM 3557]|uniref:dTDP-4-dehydrorhamnose reductase n=1 Tax=Bradyrhizobium sp. STM 3557 TaxID=578920 RepID=UPI003890A776
MLRTLLTGSSGQIGGALVRPLSAIGTVIAPSRHELDLSAPETITVALDRIAPELIINPAAYTAVDRAEDEEALAFRVNAEAPRCMASWAAAHLVPLIHLSTDYVFDGSGEQPWREDDRPAPLSVYGASKLRGEEAVRAADGPHLIIRTSWVYAVRGANFMHTIARLAGDHAELRVVADQVGAPTSASAIAEALCAILSGSPVDLTSRLAASGGLVHLACGGETSWHGFAVAIVEGLRARGVTMRVERIVPIPSSEYPTRARRPRNSRLEQARLSKVFGIALPPWQDALAHELDLLARRTPAIAGAAK